MSKSIILSAPGKPIKPALPVTVTAEQIAGVSPERAAEAIEHLAWETRHRAGQADSPSRPHDLRELVALLAVLAAITGRDPAHIAAEYAPVAPATQAA